MTNGKIWDGLITLGLLAVLTSCAEVPADEQIRRALKLKECLEVTAWCTEMGREAGDDAEKLMTALNRCTDEIQAKDCAMVLYDGINGVTRR